MPSKKRPPLLLVEDEREDGEVPVGFDDGGEVPASGLVRAINHVHASGGFEERT